MKNRKRTTLQRTTQQARIVIVTPAAGCDFVIPLAVAAVIVWFLSSVWAMAISVVVFKRVAVARRWLNGWREYLAGWREDLGLMWLALGMTVRLEFA